MVRIRKVVVVVVVIISTRAHCPARIALDL